MNSIAYISLIALAGFIFLESGDAENQNPASVDNPDDVTAYSAAWGFLHALNANMELYEEWSESWIESDREVDPEDIMINIMMQASVVGATKYLRKHPHPTLLRRCLLFMGRSVPVEFDDRWNHALLELANVNHEVTMGIDRLLAKEGHLTLHQRLEERVQEETATRRLDPPSFVNPQEGAANPATSVESQPVRTGDKELPPTEKVERNIEPETSIWGFSHSALEAVCIYEAWSTDWRTSNSEAHRRDRVINRMARNTLVGAAKYLQNFPNPKSLEYYLLSLARNVPEAFESEWRDALRELRRADDEVAAKVDRILADEDLPTLRERLREDDAE